MNHRILLCSGLMFVWGMTAWAEQATIGFRECTVSGGLVLKETVHVYCTGTTNCTPDYSSPELFRVGSDNGVGGDDHQSAPNTGTCAGACEYGAVQRDVPLTAGITTVCHREYCVATNGNKSPLSNVICCTAGVCS